MKGKVIAGIELGCRESFDKVKLNQSIHDRDYRPLIGWVLCNNGTLLKGSLDCL
jgi:hypothetical protein